LRHLLNAGLSALSRRDAKAASSTSDLEMELLADLGVGLAIDKETFSRYSDFHIPRVQLLHDLWQMVFFSVPGFPPASFTEARKGPLLVINKYGFFSVILHD